MLFYVHRCVFFLACVVFGVSLYRRRRGEIKFIMWSVYGTSLENGDQLGLDKDRLRTTHKLTNFPLAYTLYYTVAESRHIRFVLCRHTMCFVVYSFEKKSKKLRLA